MGFELKSRYIFEYWNVEKKFKKQPDSIYIQNIDIDFIFDFEKIFGWKGASKLFDLQGMNGENPNSSIVCSFHHNLLSSSCHQSGLRQLHCRWVKVVRSDIRFR